MRLGPKAQLSAQQGLIQEASDSECNVLTHQATLPNSFELRSKPITYQPFKCITYQPFKRLESSFRSSHQRCSMKKRCSQKFLKIHRKQMCLSLFFNTAAGPRTATLLKKRLWQRWFPVNFAEFLRTPFLNNNPRRLLLSIWLPKCQVTSSRCEDLILLHFTSEC